jgi:hypothetical protein
MRSPDELDAAFERITATLDTFWRLSKAGNDDAARRMRELQIVANGPDGVLGGFDRARVQRLVEILTPIYAKAGKDLKPGLRAEDLFTNDFIDRGVAL